MSGSSLDAMFVTPHELGDHIAALAELLQPHSITAVCGPLQGGAFLAHALAAYMGVRFYFTRQAPSTGEGLFALQYQLPPELRRRIANERVAIVDDAISAGSSVCATDAELTSAGATTVVVGTILLLGNKAVEHFSGRNIPVVTLAQQEFNLWQPDDCPLCQTGAPLESLLVV